MEIVCGSRLHFGLLHVPHQPERENAQTAAPLRVYGGAGLMIEEPALRLEAYSSETLSA